MKRRLKQSFALLAAGLVALFLTPGCETDEDEFDHKPPAGQGSIIVDNYTYTDIEFYVNGLLTGKINDDKDEAFDLAPGVYRIVLNDEDDQRNWAGDVDVLEGQLTILSVTIDATDFNDYAVEREIQ